MNRETLVWAVLFFGGAGFLAYQSATSERGVGRQYVVPVQVAGTLDEATKEITPVVAPASTDGVTSLSREGVTSSSTDRATSPSTDRVTSPSAGQVTVLKSVRYDKASKDDPHAIRSWSRTLGVWVAALLTLCVFSYLYRDNVFYKLAESIIVGVSAGYWIVLSFWEVLIAKVLVKLAPDVARYAFLPDTPPDATADYSYVVPVVLGCLVFCRLVPKIAWLGRWPLAFVVGTTAGLKLILFLNADFIQQVRSTILPLVVVTANETRSQLDWKQSIQNIVMVVSVLSSVTYFYFSVEHKGLVGRISRMGIWVLMISFGASFALTVMGRITLLTMRLQFLFDDWLGLVHM